MRIYLVSYGVKYSDKCGDAIRTDDVFVLADNEDKAKCQCAEYLKRIGATPVMDLMYPQEIRAIHANDYSVEFPDGTMKRNLSGQLHIDQRMIGS